MPVIVQISDLSFSYGPTPVLEGICLTVERGATLGVIGPNGGGKTTLIRLLLGMLEPSAGTIRINGLTPRQAVRRGDQIGYLPQHPSVQTQFPINVRQVVHMGLAGKTGMLKPYQKDDLNFADHLIQSLGLGALAESPVAMLSGGQLQRVLIARALAPRPKLLLLDEPTTGVDRTGQGKFIESLDSLRAEMGLTVVLVSHDLRAVSGLCDRIACVDQTLHYHDVPDHLPADLVYRMFACDLEAMGIKGGHVCTHGAAHTHVIAGANGNSEGRVSAPAHAQGAS